MRGMFVPMQYSFSNSDPLVFPGIGSTKVSDVVLGRDAVQKCGQATYSPQRGEIGAWFPPSAETKVATPPFGTGVPIPHKKSIDTPEPRMVLPKSKISYHPMVNHRIEPDLVVPHEKVSPSINGKTLQLNDSDQFSMNYNTEADPFGFSDRKRKYVKKAESFKKVVKPASEDNHKKKKKKAASYFKSNAIAMSQLNRINEWVQPKSNDEVKPMKENALFGGSDGSFAYSTKPLNEFLDAPAFAKAHASRACPKIISHVIVAFKPDIKVTPETAKELGHWLCQSVGAPNMDFAAAIHFEPEKGENGENAIHFVFDRSNRSFEGKGPGSQHLTAKKLQCSLVLLANKAVKDGIAGNKTPISLSKWYTAINQTGAKINDIPSPLSNVGIISYKGSSNTPELLIDYCNHGRSRAT